MLEEGILDPTKVTRLAHSNESNSRQTERQRAGHEVDNPPMLSAYYRPVAMPGATRAGDADVQLTK